MGGLEGIIVWTLRLLSTSSIANSRSIAHIPRPKGLSRGGVGRWGGGGDKFHPDFYSSDLNSISFPKSPTAKLFLVIRLLKLSTNKGWGGRRPSKHPIFAFLGWHLSLPRLALCKDGTC